MSRSSPTKPTFSPGSFGTNSYPLSRDTSRSSEALLLSRATEFFLEPLPSPLKSSEPFVQRAPAPRDAALIRELSAALESMSIDRPNVEGPRVKKVTWEDDYAAKTSKSKQRSRLRGHSIKNSAPAEAKSNWRSGSHDPQFKGSSSLNWRPTCNAQSDMNMASGKNKGTRSRGNSVSTGISAERKRKRRESLNPS